MLLIVKSLLSLLDMLFPETIIKVVNKLSPMKTIQPSINLWDTPEKYNGWNDSVSYTHLTLPTNPEV